MADWQAMAFSFVLFLLPRRPGRQFVTGHSEVNDFGGGSGLAGWLGRWTARPAYVQPCLPRTARYVSVRSKFTDPEVLSKKGQHLRRGRLLYSNVWIET